MLKKSILCLSTVLLVSLSFNTLSHAKTLKGTVTYEAVSGKKCDKTTKPIKFKIKGDLAEVHVGKKPDGVIRIDPQTGAFKEKHTNDGDVMKGTIYSGKILKKKCTGTYTAS